MNNTENRITVYDGNCNFCRSVITTLKKWKWIDSDKVEAYYELSADKQAKIDVNHFRSEMAIIDMNGGRTYYGLEGVLYAVGYRFPVLRKIKKESFLFPIMQFFYRNIAWNRYIIMRPVSTVKCDCEPPLNKPYRISLFAFCALVAVLITGLFGMTSGATLAGTWFPMHDMLTFARTALIVIGSGWVLQLLIARFLLRGEQFYDYMGHLGIIMLVGVLVLLPSMVLSLLPDGIFLFITGISIVISSALMISMHSKRAHAIGLNRGWTISWLACLYGCVIFWFIYGMYQVKA